MEALKRLEQEERLGSEARVKEMAKWIQDEETSLQKVLREQDEASKPRLLKVLLDENFNLDSPRSLVEFTKQTMPYSESMLTSKNT